MKKKSFKSIIALLFLLCIVIAFVIFLFLNKPSNQENPEASGSPKPTNQSSNTTSPKPSASDETKPLEGLNRDLPSEKNPKIHIVTWEDQDFSHLFEDKLSFAIVKFPNSDVAAYEDNSLILNKEIFHSFHNHIGTITLVGYNKILSGLLFSDKEGPLYIDEIKESKVEKNQALMIANRLNPLEPAMIETWSRSLVQLSNPDYIRDGRQDLYIMGHVKEALEDLIAYSKQDDPNLNLYVTSAFRDYNTQKYSFDWWVEKRVKEEGMTYNEAYEFTAGRVAIPGTSEHHNGLTMDVLTYGYMLDESSKGAPYAKWLKENSYKYGFTIRYEEGKEDYTMITLYEPWHIRYVGKETAFYLHQENLCLEEFYERLLENKLINFEFEDKNFVYIYRENQNLFIDEAIAEIVELSDISSSVQGEVLLLRLK